MGFLDRFRRKDPNAELEDFVRSAVGEDGRVYGDSEPGIVVFDYKGLGMALDVTEHPFISVLFCGDEDAVERYGRPLDEVRASAPEGLEIEEDAEGNRSLITGEPLLNGEDADIDAMRTLLERFAGIDASLRTEPGH